MSSALRTGDEMSSVAVASDETPEVTSTTGKWSSITGGKEVGVRSAAVAVGTSIASAAAEEDGVETAAARLSL